MHRKLNPLYLNACGKDIEFYFKPVKFFNLFESSSILNIIDIELVEMGREIYFLLFHTKKHKNQKLLKIMQNIFW